MTTAILAGCRDTELLEVSSERVMKLKKKPEGHQELGKVRSEGFRILRPQRVRVSRDEPGKNRHTPSRTMKN